MKKYIAILLTLSIALAFAACGSSAPAATSAPAASEAPVASEAPAELEKIVVGATSTPHGEILEQVKDALAAEGYELDIVIYDDYVLPNQALDEGTLDANYFQHTPYLNYFNESNGTNLVSAASIHYEPFGLYGNGITTVAEIADGATIVVPADGSNETRALLLLAQEGLVELDPAVNIDTGITTLDIVDAHGYNVVAVQADTVPAQLANSEIGSAAVINGNYALAAGLHCSDALAVESTDGDAAQTYANIIACRAGEENSEKITALVKALTTDAVKEYIANTYNGAVVAIF